MYISWKIGAKHHCTIIVFEDSVHEADAIDFFEELASDIGSNYYFPQEKLVNNIAYWPDSGREGSGVTVAQITCPELMTIGNEARELARMMGYEYMDNYDYNPHVTMAEGLIEPWQYDYFEGDELWFDTIALSHQGQVLASKCFTMQNMMLGMLQAYAENNTVIPPKFVANIAQRALTVRKSLPKSKQCCLPTGLKRANQLAKQQKISLRTLKRMKNFIERMQKQARSKDPSTSKAFQSLMIWGSMGDGRTLKWIERSIKKLEAQKS